MSAEPALAPTQGWDFNVHGLDRGFFKRVYLRSSQLGAAGCLISMGLEQRPSALGLLCGLVVGLFSLFTVEATVRLFFNGGGFAGLKLCIGACLKLPFLAAGLTGIAWACVRHVMNPFAVAGGVLLTHAVILVMAVAAAMANPDTGRVHSR
jgi:hypothetical protein